MNRRKRLENWQVTFVGLTATAIALVVYAVGGFDWAEQKTLDLRFRYTNSIPEDPRIVCVDIDDQSLKTVGRWPWPRDVQAELLAILAELQPRALLLDITLVEPQPVRTIVPEAADIVTDPLALGVAGATLAFPDSAIRAAIAAGPPVYLACDFTTGLARSDYLPDRLLSHEFRSLVETLELRGPAPARELARQTWPPPRKAVKWLARELRYAHCVQALTADPLLSAAELDKVYGLWEPSAQAEARRAAEHALIICRQIGLRRFIHRWLDADRQRWRDPPQTLFAALCAALEHDQTAPATRYEDEISHALRDVLGLKATFGRNVAAPNAVRADPVDQVTPVYFQHARAARRCGFVVFDPDPDGIMRHTRLFAYYQRRILPQLTVALALDGLPCTPDGVTRHGGFRFQLFRTPQRRFAAQVDAQGRTLVPWVARRDWTRQFGGHLPVDAVWQVFDRRQSIRRNRERILTLLAPLVDQPFLATCRQTADDLRQVLRLEDDLRLSRYRADAALAAQQQQWLDQYRPLLRDGLRTLAQDCQAALTAPATAPSLSDEARTSLAQITQALAANDEYHAEIDQTLRRLRERVQDRFVVVGYTATALADMTPIPTHPRAPGVVAHANLLNGLLTGRLMRWLPAWLNAVIALVVGTMATLISVRWRLRPAAGLLLPAAALYLAACAYAFYQWDLWVAAVPALAALFGSYVAVLLFRYVFLERESRQIAVALSQYTSPALARKMSEDAELCKRAESRQVTSVFTDLAGFTALSEAIGAERTQHVLNVSLGHFSDVILRYEGMINKFIGDGIFAFWNPVIYPQPDHARRACETAIDLQIALRALVDMQHTEDEAFGRLVLRVGVATGRAVVGPCGSEQKYDYTCIGDSVNVASRLESANKFYGTRILISGATLENAGDGFVVRPLGGVQVKGKTRAVPIFELLGRAGAVTDDLRQYADRFGQAVIAFQQRAWTQALDAFEACLQTRPDDLAAHQYADAVRQYQTASPPDDWNAALELTEK